ncbi:MAG: ATP synthase F1 subunit delta, partial [Chloroflexi bacterium]|nr:ATP synthase F1 subunit delta [Chloroflexota bacterium]
AKDRLSMAGEIADEYQRLLSAYQGIEEAEVTTAIPLDDEDRQSLEKRLEAIFNKKIVVRADVDSSLIGGVVARIGGKLLDGSTRSRLQALKKQMSGVNR